MRILVDIRHLASSEPSGVGEYTVQLLRSLLRVDRENAYVLFSSGKKKPTMEGVGGSEDGRVTPIHLPTSNKFLNLRSLILHHPSLNQFVREGVDLIFLPNLNIVTLPEEIPTVLTLHDLSFQHFPELYSRRMRLWHHATAPEALAKRAGHIITPSHATAQDVCETYGVNPSCVTTIAHGVHEAFSPLMQARDHGVRSRLKLPRRFALFVGTLEPRKNLLGLIEAVRQYRERAHDDLSLVLAGKWGWKSASVRHRLYKNDVRGWVRTLGYVKSEDKPALYRSAEVLIWPSLYEGFGLPVLEAMASGCPVITTRTSSLPELTGNAAILVDPLHTGDLADALAQLLSSSPLRQTLRESGLTRASQFSWEKTAKKTLDVFTHTQNTFVRPLSPQEERSPWRKPSASP
ncbi:glycosyltransferase family 4 protein [Candidatus Parcubacteria bacterium]|nr:glycosyltransferase family 4 protein [Candidatus Parcubacteria bacterium]